MESTTPTQKVIDLLTDLKATSESELENEAKVFTEFLSFAEEKLKAKADAIDADNLKIETANGGIDAAKAGIASAQGDFAAAKAEETKKSAALSEKTELWLAEKATLKKTEADLNNALKALGGAIEHLKSAKSEDLISLKTTIRQNVKLAHSLGVSTPKISLLSEDPSKDDGHTNDVSNILNMLRTAFKSAKHSEKTEAVMQNAEEKLEQAIEHVNSLKAAQFIELKDSDTIHHDLQLAEALGLSTRATSFLSKGPGEYDYHSNDIIKILGSLKTELTQKSTDVKTEIDNGEAAFVTYREATEEAIKAAQQTAESAEATESEETINLGEHEQDLSNGEIDLKNDSQYHKDLQARYDTKKAEWGQRKQGREDEIAAINGALEQLTGTVTEKEVGRKQKAFVQRPGKDTKKPEADKKDNDKKLSKPASFLQIMRALSPVATDPTHEKAAAFILAQGKELKSATLEHFASQMTGPFDKVKNLIQALIERLLDEAANEADHQGKCATERKEAEMNRQHRTEDIQRTNAELQTLSAAKGELEVKIDDLTIATGDLEKTLAKDTELRQEDKDNNIKAIKDAKDGLAALESAVQILTEYYKGVHGVGGADTARVFIQASPIDEEGKWQDVSNIKGAYKGSQGASGNIFGLLAVIKSDFQREISTTEADEKKTQEDYVKAKREDSASLASKRTELKNAESDLLITTSKIDIGFKNLETAAERQGKAIKVLELLWDRCVAIEMTPEQRKEKIEKEVEALKKAVEILTPKNP